MKLKVDKTLLIKNNNAIIKKRNEYIARQSLSFENGLYLKGSLELYLGSRLDLIPEACKNYLDYSAEERKFNALMFSRNPFDIINLATPEELFEAVQTLSEEDQITLLEEALEARKYSFPVNRKDQVISKLCQTSVKISDYLSFIRLKPSKNAVWFLQVAPALLSSKKLSSDVFYLITAMILPTPLSLDPDSIKNIFIRLHNSRLPENPGVMRGAARSISNFFSPRPEKLNYIERTKGLLTEKEQDIELSKVWL